MNQENVRGGLTAEDRQRIYQAAGISDANVIELEAMVVSAGLRDVGRGALRNVVVEHQSKKNADVRIVESHTCELIFAYECELDPGVRGYYAQVPCPYVARLRGGRRHVSSATLDFLVFKDAAVQLVECKTQEWMEAEITKPKTDWEMSGGVWRNAALEPYAEARQIQFIPWLPPSPPGIYLQNLQACYAVSGEVPPPRHVLDAVTRRIQQCPSTIDELASHIAGFSPRTALWMLAAGKAFGPWKSISIGCVHDFRLYAEKHRADLADAAGLTQLNDAIAQPTISAPICLASAVDLARGQQRLDRLVRMQRGEEPWTRRYKTLMGEVRDGERNGKSPLEVCLTAYRRSGNKTPRLLSAHYQTCGEVLQAAWNSGGEPRPIDLYFAFEKACEERGIEPCSRWVLDTRRRQLDPTKRALNTGGMRAYQAIRPATDPRFRSLPPIGYGTVLHVDSSKFDLRLQINDHGDTVLLVAQIYVGVDGTSERTMAHSLIFGAARTDGLALLMRDFVRRHGFLPAIIHLDRGSENRSTWLKTFSLGRISLRRSPTAGGPWNGLAEEAIKQINDQIAHRLPGSTLPDRAGRKTDGRFKSYKTAKLTVSFVHEQLAAFLYGDSVERLGIDGLTIDERSAVLASEFGKFGTTCAYDDAFVYATSLPMPLRKKFNKRRGIRTEDGWFTSKELQDAVRKNAIEEVRTDCESQEVLHVKVGGSIVDAFHSKVLSMARMDPLDKQIELQFAPVARRLSRLQRVAGARKRYTRLQYSKMRFHTGDTTGVTPVTDDVGSLTAAPAPIDVTENSDTILPREFRYDDLEPFPEEYR